MSKFEKALGKIKEIPPRADVSWSELVRVLDGLGYSQLKPGKTGGSRRRFYNKEKDLVITCHEPHPQPNVDKACLRDVVEHLTTNGLLMK